MIARVTLLRRMPAGRDEFDYEIPSGITAPIGYLVQIPYRTSVVYGVVTGISETSPFKVRPIDAVICPLVTEQDILLMHELATEYHVSLSTVLLMFVPPIPKRHPELLAINPDRLIPPHNAVTLTTYKSDNDVASFVRDLSPIGVHLIIVPAFSYLTALPSTVSVLLTATPKQKKEAHLQAVSLTAGVVASTRSALFLPFTNLASITILDEEHSGHKSWESSPRYHTLEVCYLISQIRRVPIHILSRFPRVETAFSPIVTEKRTIESNSSLILPTLITQRGHAIITQTLHDAVETARANGTQVIVWCATKHTAAGLVCRDCGTVVVCSTCGERVVVDGSNARCVTGAHTEPIPGMCSRCGNISVQTFAPGAAGYATLLQKEFGNDVLTLIDASHKPETLADETLVIGTSTLFDHIDWKRVHALFLVDIPVVLAIPDYRMLEEVGALMIFCAAKLAEYAPDAGFYVYSNERTSETLSPLVGGQLSAWYASEIAARKQFNLPPYTRIITLERLSGPIPYQLEKYSISSTHDRATFAIPHQMFNDVTHLLHANLPPTTIVDVDPLKLL